MIKLPVKILNIRSVEPIVMLSHDTASRLKFKHKEVVAIKNERTDKTFSATPVVVENLIENNVVGISEADAEWLSVSAGDEVIVLNRRKPISFDLIQQKMGGQSWNKQDVYSIVNDISKRQYTNIEIASFALTSQFRGYNQEEVSTFARAMAESGTMLDFQEKAFDKHSIGGVPGNKVSLLIVPIVAAAGLLIPKTSSRAITSPSGTADSMEVLADVTFTAEELTEIAPKTRGVIVWNAPLKLSPMDDIVIGVKKFLDVDPQEQMMASIISTKIAMGIDHLVIDLPTGPATKMKNQSEAIKFGHSLISLCNDVNIDVEALITSGVQPIGANIGPALEAKEAFEILEGKPGDLVLNKSTELAGALLEMGGLAETRQGRNIAIDIVKSGKALEKLREIIEAQGGDGKIKSSDIPIAAYSHTIRASFDGHIMNVNNKGVKNTCRAAGAPSNKTSGMVIHTKVGADVKRGDPLFTIYSDSETKLSSAIQVANNDPPIVVEGLILRRLKTDHS